MFKAEYFLPENASNVLDILSDPFLPTTRPLTGTGRRRRSNGKIVLDEEELIETTTDDYYSRGFDELQHQKYEQYSVAAKLVEAGPDESPTEPSSEYEDYGPIAAEDDIENDAKQFTLNDVKIKQPNNLATARFTLYKGMESMVSK